METGEAIEWYRRIGKICGIPMIAGLTLSGIGVLLNNQSLMTNGLIIFVIPYTMHLFLIKGLHGGSEGGKKNKKVIEPPTPPVR